MAVLLGRLTAGSGTSDFLAAGDTGIWGPFVASASGKLKYIYVITQSANATVTAIDAGAYADSAGEPPASPALCSGPADSLAVARGATVWRATMTVPADIVAGQSYWLGIHGATANFTFKGDTLSNAYRESATAVDFPTWSPGSDLPGNCTLIIWGESEDAGGGDPQIFWCDSFGPGDFGPDPFNEVLNPVGAKPPTPVAFEVALSLNTSLSRVVNRATPVALTLNTSVSRQVNRVVPVALTLATSVSRVVSRVVPVALTLATSVSRVVNRVVAVPLTLATSVSRVVQRTIAVALTFGVSVALARTLAVAISLALTLNTTVSRQINRNVSVALTLNTTVSRQIQRVVSLALSLPVTVSRIVSRNVAVSLTLAASVSRVVQRKLGLALAFAMTVTPTFVPSGTIFNISITVPLNLVPSLSISPRGIIGAIEARANIWLNRFGIY